MKRSMLVLLIGLAVATSAARAGELRTLHVDPSRGKDVPVWNANTLYATLQGALNELVRINANADAEWNSHLLAVLIRLEPGTYELDKPIVLDKRYAGKFSVRIFGGDGRTRLIGGKIITGLAAVTDPAIRKRLGEAADKVRCVNLSDAGINDFGQLSPRGFGRPGKTAHLEVFFNGQPLTLARYPNEGWLKIDGVGGRPGNRNLGADRFVWKSDRPSRWQARADVWLHGYWVHDWADSYVKLDRYDPKTRLVHTRQPHGVYGYKTNQRFRVLNVLEKLDAPGEWWLDRQTGMLYVWPPSDPDKGELIVSTLAEPLVQVKGLDHVWLDGLTIEAGRSHGVTVEGGTKVTLKGCTVRNTGRCGVVVTGGTEHRIDRCEIYGTGEAAISLKGGDRKTLTPAKFLVEKCKLHHYARWVRTYQPAVRLSGVGMTVRRCEIHHAPHNGIHFGGNEMLIELNDIRDVCRETGDVGAIYTGRDWTYRGNVIRFNRFADIRGVGRFGATAVYLDDCSGGASIVGNAFLRCRRGVLLGGGRDTSLDSNVFVDCDLAVHLDARGLGWASQRIKARRGDSWDLHAKLDRVDHDGPVWSKAYPRLAEILKNHPRRPVGNELVSNVCIGGEFLKLVGEVDPDWVRTEDNVTDAPDGGLRAPRKGDFRPVPEGPADRAAYIPPPVGQIGPDGKYALPEDPAPKGPLPSQPARVK